MQEPGYIRSVHRHLPDEKILYRWKINARFQNGVPDCWYSGNLDDYWIEYKYVPQPPKTHIPVRLTALQRQWLRLRKREGRNVAVVIGTPLGGVILQHYDSLEEDFIPYPNDFLTTKEVAEWIIERTTTATTHLS